MAVELPAEIRLSESPEGAYLDIVGDETALAERDTDTYARMIPDAFPRLLVGFPVLDMPVENIRTARIVALVRTEELIADTGHTTLWVSLTNDFGRDYGFTTPPHGSEYVEVSTMMHPEDHWWLTEPWSFKPQYSFHPGVLAEPSDPYGWAAVYMAYLAIIVNESGRRRVPHLRGFQRGSDGQGITGGKRGIGNRSRQASIRRGPGSFY